MIADAIARILEISKPEIHTVKDVHDVETIFSTKPLHQVKAAAPDLPPLVPVVTLAGFADLVRTKLEEISIPGPWAIHIENECTVSLKNLVSDEYGRRALLVRAQPVPFRQFKFDSWTGQEEFVIGLASLFADTPDKQYVLSMASSLTGEATSLNEDDGFTQKATVKAGLRHKESVTLKPRVELAPYRTFPEVEQPASQFVFRAKTAEGSQPLLMLVEADGGRWKIDAIKTLRAALEGFDLGLPIIA